MKKQIHIHIPEPCHEDWKKMTPTQKGRHCASCEKEVIDFSKMSDRELSRILKNGASGCGRFKSSQLEKALPLQKKTPQVLQYAASLLIPFTLLGSLQQSQANNTKKENSYISLQIGSEHTTDKNQNKTNDLIKISGTVTDDSGLPLPGVNILVKGTKKGTQSDFNGLYTLEVSLKDVLVFSYVGFETQEKTITNTSLQVNITLKAGELLGEVSIIAGGYMVKSEPEFYGTEEASKKRKFAAAQSKAMKNRKRAEKKAARKEQREARRKERKNK